MTNAPARVRGKYAVAIGGKPTAPSVTAISGMLEKGGLPWGAAAETAKFAIHHQEEWITLETNEAYERLRTHHKGVWDDKKNRGTKVHDFAAQWAAGTTVDCPPDCAPYLDALEAFYAEHKPQWLEIEQAVICDTPGLEYGGTFDANAVLADGRTHKIDFKTGGRYPTEVAIQLSAYRFAPFMGVYDAFGTLTALEPNRPVDCCDSLYLHDDGTYELLEVPANEAAYETFKHLRGVYGWLADMRKWERAHPEPERQLAEVVA